MSRRKSTDPSELLTDPGVLEPTPTLEVFGDRAVAAVGGAAVLPHRGAWLRARQRSLAAAGWFSDEPEPGFRQAVVHLQKGRAATEEGLAEAWDRLEPGGRLLFVGGNELGIKSAVKRLAAAVEALGEVVANRARARVIAWARTDAALHCPQPAPIELRIAGRSVDLRTAPGVFSADGVDPGTALLLDHLEGLDAPATVFDPGCGVGVLGLAALLLWPDATAVLADVDHRAVACARANAVALGLAHRCDIAWWDAVREPPPLQRCDLALVNPPFHSGVPVDLQPGRSIFACLNAVVAPGGRALVVANRTLPWERDLGGIGRLVPLADSRGYKLLEIRR